MRYQRPKTMRNANLQRAKPSSCTCQSHSTLVYEFRTDCATASSLTIPRWRVERARSQCRCRWRLCSATQLHWIWGVASSPTTPTCSRAACASKSGNECGEVRFWRASAIREASSFEPHLHFEVTTGSSALDGEGVPYIIDEYTVTASNGDAPGRRTHELPVTRALVEFGGNAAVSK